MEIPDLSHELYSAQLHGGANACSVGWLGTTVPRKGSLPPELLQALRHYSDANYHEDWLLGTHTCEICERAEGHGEFSIDWDGVRYVLPILVLHYCEAHGYLPPSEFIDALVGRWRADGGGGTG